MKNYYDFKAETIVAFSIGSPFKPGTLHFLDKNVKIGDYAKNLFSPCDEEGNDINDPKAEWTHENGNSTGLTNAMVESGIGSINIDESYNTTYTDYANNLSEKELKAILDDSYNSRAYGLVRGSNLAYVLDEDFAFAIFCCIINNKFNLALTYLQKLVGEDDLEALAAIANTFPELDWDEWCKCIEKAEYIEITEDDGYFETDDEHIEFTSEYYVVIDNE